MTGADSPLRIGIGVLIGKESPPPSYNYIRSTACKRSPQIRLTRDVSGGEQRKHARQGVPLKFTDSQAEREAADSAPASCLGLVRQLFGHHYVVKLALWSVFLGVSIVALRTLFDPGLILPNAAGHAFLEICGVLIGGGIVYCLWVRYCVSTQRWILLTAIAFSGLTLGELFHAISAAATFDGFHALQRLGLQYYDAWRLAAGCLLIAAVRSTVVDGKPNCRTIGVRMLRNSLVLSLCLIAAAYELGTSWPAIAGRLQVLSAEVLHYIGRLAVSSPLVSILSLAVLATAFAMFARLHILEEDAFSDAITRYLLLAMAGQGAILVSADSYGPTWWLSHAFGIAALMTLLIELGTQFGASYADAQTRIEHLEAVHCLSSRLSTTLDLRVVLLALVSDAASMLSARCAAVMLADETGETLETAATHGLPEGPLAPREPQKVEGSGRPGFYSGHTARAYREKRVCVVDDVYTDVQFVPWRELARHEGYTVSVPLVYQEVALGVLNLFFDKHVPLNDERIKLLQTLASAAAVAIANAQLYDRTLNAESEDTAARTSLLFKLAS